MSRVISTGFLYLFLLGTIWMHLHWSAALLLSLLVASSWHTLSGLWYGKPEGAGISRPHQKDRLKTMKPISPVLPHSEFPEVVLAKNQPEYIALPVAKITYSDGTKSMVSHYRLTLRERLRLLFLGSLWVEQLTFGHSLQPQRPTVYEPFHHRKDMTR